MVILVMQDLDGSNSVVTAYRGRFAPSPNGPLHFGSLVAAVGSWLEARTRGGEWRLRMEDVDGPRCSPATADIILHQLEACALDWDGPVVWQSRRDEAYRAALDRLLAAGRAYPCACTRREIGDSLLAPDGAAIYPGTCRNGLPPGRMARSWRLRVEAAVERFVDAVQGEVTGDLAHDCGDFVLLRADGCFAYQLAVVVDDAGAGITDVVRGADLLHSTPRQIFLQRCLGLPALRYIHLPVAVDTAGEKLSKQTRAAAVDPARPGPALVEALRFLGQSPPVELVVAPPREILAWARENWTLSAVPPAPTLAYNPPQEEIP